MAMVVIEFGGLKELADTANNYHTNINKLYGNFNEFTLAIDKVVQNIIVLMYANARLPALMSLGCMLHPRKWAALDVMPGSIRS